MIEIHGLSKKYGDLSAIENISFTVKKGEVVGFLGPNGAGKSTTMKIITGFMAPTTGSVSVAGFDVFENPIEVKKRIGFLPEHPPVYTDMYVRDYLEYVANLKGVVKEIIAKNVDDAIAACHLEEVQHRVIGNLSKGFRQRVGIAQALVSKPEILILDEPTVGLDPKQVAEIRHLIKDLAGKHTVILSTHILPEVQASCQRIIIIDKGRIVAEDTLEGLNQRLSGSHRLRIKVRRPSVEFAAKLRSYPGALNVHEGASGVYEIDMSQKEDNAEKLAEFVVAQHVGLVELTVASMSLEDIFLKLTSHGDAGGVA